MRNTRRNKKIGIKHVALVVFSLLFIMVGISCGKKEDGVKTPVETPSVVTPETQSNGGVVEGEKEPAETGSENDLNVEELKDLFKSGKALEKISYTMEMSGYGQEPMMIKVWMMDGQMRFDSFTMGETFTTLMNKDGFFSFSESEKVAMKMPLGGINNPMDKTFSLDNVTSDLDTSTFNYLGKEKINGVTCLVVESKSMGEGTVKMWLHEKYGIAMKMETEIKDQDGSFVMEIKDFNVDNIPDSIFKVPEGYEILDLGNMEFPNIPKTP